MYCGPQRLHQSRAEIKSKPWRRSNREYSVPSSKPCECGVGGMVAGGGPVDSVGCKFGKGVLLVSAGGCRRLIPRQQHNPRITSEGCHDEEFDLGSYTPCHHCQPQRRQDADRHRLLQRRHHGGSPAPDPSKVPGRCHPSSTAIAVRQ